MTILDRIIETKHVELAEAVSRIPLQEMKARARAAAPVRGFRKQLLREDVAVIAEIKKASPSAGLIRADFDPVEIAQAYQTGGAAALSVLTDRIYFQGSLEIMDKVRRAVSLPVLRKDFTIDPYQIYEARAAGADAVLLIVAVLDEDQLRILYETTRETGMDALVEVHTQEEMEMAARLDADMIGINNRNLKTFETRLDTTAEVAALMPSGCLLAALSGITGPEDVWRMAEEGARAVLVGELLMRSADVAATTRRLCGVRCRKRPPALAVA